MRRPALSLCICLAIGSAASVTAKADVFGPIGLVSESPVQQADYAHDPAISGNGRYVAFDGSFGGRTGVWRGDLQSGAVEVVALGDAELPSISADGRYVSFTTTAVLTPGDHNEGPDVYVRDMDVNSAAPCTEPITEEASPCAFQLASAADGSAESLSYGASSEPRSYGSLAGGRYALSADGRKVVFVTTAVSDLTGSRPPQAPSTPPLQVAVRDLDTHSTELVTAGREGGTPVPGAVYVSGGVIPPFKPVEGYGESSALGASISADGSTVAWLAQNVGAQATLLPGETVPSTYTEPLWRRIADGPAAPIRRVTGGSDPQDPACIAGGESSISGETPASDPCQGPFATLVERTASGTWTGGFGDVVPQLSGDGYTVAFLANAPLVAFGANFGRSENHSDLYVVDMRPGPTRDAALRPLTELAGGQSADLATNAPIIDLGISPDGTQVAFTTKRTVFPLGSPAYVSAPAPVPGLAELFDVDLSNATLTRVTQGFEGGAGEHPHLPKPTGEDPYLRAGDGALSPSFSSNGDLLAFSSTAANLAYGDGNTPPLGHESKVFDGSDAFVVPRIVFSSQPPEQEISASPPPPQLTPPWRLSATALSRRDGSVLLEIAVPAAGVLRAAARGAVAVRVAVSSRNRHSGHGRSRLVALTRTLATRAASVKGVGVVALALKLAARYAKLAASGAGLTATVAVVFSAPGHPVLHETIEVRFVRAPTHKRHGPAHPPRGGRR
jgi:Tol biopolymer transport system component